ncbi:MAG: serine hydrolase [Ignavibacteriales bacterium]|nr:serine hydrolase [Ignavibacteriales bacterium]
MIIAFILSVSAHANAQEEARVKAPPVDSTQSVEARYEPGIEVYPAGRFTILPDNEGRLAFDPILAYALQRALDSVRTSQRMAGVSAAVLVPGQGVWQGVSGVSSKTPSISIQPEMLFGIGSNTKAFISTTILSLADAGALSLDDPLSKWLPPYPNITGSVTIRQLLNMTSGLYDYLNDSNAQGDSVAANPTRLWTPEELIRTFVGPPHRLPGGAYSYCNTDYVLLGMVINKVTGKSVSSQIRQRILAPLSLDHTYLEVEEHYIDPVAHPWDSGIDFASIPVTAHFSTLWTAGGVMSTGENMARWVKALYEGAVISPSARAQMLTFVPASSTQTTGFVWSGYGLGVRRGAYYGKSVLGHAGAVMGYVSIAGYFPTTGVSAVVLFNASEGGAGSALTALFDVYLHSVETRVAHPGLCYALAGAADSARVCLADTSTGVLTAVGTTQYGTIVNARIDARTGKVWGLASANGWELVQIDGESGEAFPRIRIKFPAGAPTDFKGLDFTLDGAILIGSVDGRIYKVDPATGAAALAVTSRISISGLALDPTSGVLWASIRTSAVLRDRIFRIDMATGDTVGAGNTGFNSPLVDLAFDRSGNLFGLVGNPSSSVQYRLARINKSTGAGTEIGSLGLYGMMGIAFSPASIRTSADGHVPGGAVTGFRLEQNYPNPFNPSTTFSFDLATRSLVSLKVYDAIGREVSQVAYEELPAGHYARQWNASALPSGMYFYRLSVVPLARPASPSAERGERDLVPTEGRNGQAGSFAETKKLLLLK